MRWLLAALALSACGSRPETLPDGGSLHGPVVFRVSLFSQQNRPMYLQSGGAQHWLTVLDAEGRPLSWQADCSKCLCDQCDSCAVCGLALPKAIQVPNLSSTSATWSGLTFHPGGQCEAKKAECQQRRSAQPGRYAARICHGFEVAQEPSGAQTVLSPSCQEVPFDYPADGGVQVEICDC